MFFIKPLCAGAYYIDPNGACPSDAFQVMCDFEDGSCSTCIDATEMVLITKIPFIYYLFGYFISCIVIIASVTYA